jgi:hypothetical protein
VGTQAPHASDARSGLQANASRGMLGVSEATMSRMIPKGIPKEMVAGEPVARGRTK